MVIIKYIISVCNELNKNNFSWTYWNGLYGIPQASCRAEILV